MIHFDINRLNSERIEGKYGVSAYVAGPNQAKPVSFNNINFLAIYEMD